MKKKNKKDANIISLMHKKNGHLVTHIFNNQGELTKKAFTDFEPIKGYIYDIQFNEKGLTVKREQA